VTAANWHCGDCPHDLTAASVEVGLVRLAIAGEEGFELGAAGIEEAVRPLLAPCACGGRLVPGPGDGTAHASAVVVAPDVLAAGWAVLERATDPGLVRLRDVWRPRALRILGRVGELGAEDVLDLRLEDRLAALEAEIRRAGDAGDEDAAQMAHARYIELGTTYVRRVVAR
jgi:hypothetical protein